MSPPELARLLTDAALHIEQARTLPVDSWFAHFALGTLRRDAALRFIEVHDRHHLEIVEEIVAACGRTHTAAEDGFTRV